jgi:hypothetical protein
MQSAMRQIGVTLRDSSEEQSNVVPIQINYRETGINLCPQGYGDANSEPGFGGPIFLEVYRGELRLIVWSDINHQEPTHVISLEAAREDRRNDVLPVD